MAMAEPSILHPADARPVELKLVEEGPDTHRRTIVDAPISWRRGWGCWKQNAHLRPIEGQIWLLKRVWAVIIYIKQRCNAATAV